MRDQDERRVLQEAGVYDVAEHLVQLLREINDPSSVSQSLSAGGDRFWRSVSQAKLARPVVFSVLDGGSRKKAAVARRRRVEEQRQRMRDWLLKAREKQQRHTSKPGTSEQAAALERARQEGTGRPISS